jgi:phthalate 4,5-cis-dihydrodiol dehydrogenase
MVPTLAADPRVELVAAADPRPEARQRFAADFSARTYVTVSELCADTEVEAIYVATPHQYHAEHASAAAAHGKHILVEKPMALSLEDCSGMIAAARRANVHLIIGHSHSFDAPIRRARQLIESGAFGAVKMISTLDFTDFLYRARRPDELDTAKGGGVIFNQAAHQIDVVRLLGGGRVRSVRALTGAWDAARPTEGAYSALLTFEQGTFASVTYSGYAHFDSDEFCGWISETGMPKDRTSYGATRSALQRVVGEEGERALKSAQNYGGTGYDAAGGSTAPAATLWHQHFGLVVVSCEKADLRPLPTGVMVYEDLVQRLDALPAPRIPRSEVIDELHDAIVHSRAPVHSGEWGMATLEVCLAMMQSAREGREIVVENQVGLPDSPAD